MSSPLTPVARHASDYLNQPPPQAGSPQNKSISETDVTASITPTPSRMLSDPQVQSMRDSPSQTELTVQKTAEVAKEAKLTDHIAFLLQANNEKFGRCMEAQTQLLTVLAQSLESKKPKKKKTLGQLWMKAWGLRHIDYVITRAKLASALACMIIGGIGLSLIAPSAIKDCFSAIRQWSLAPISQGHTFKTLVGFGALFAFGENVKNGTAFTADALSAVSWWK